MNRTTQLVNMIRARCACLEDGCRACTLPPEEKGGCHQDTIILQRCADLICAMASDMESLQECITTSRMQLQELKARCDRLQQERDDLQAVIDLS